MGGERNLLPQPTHVRRHLRRQGCSASGSTVGGRSGGTGCLRPSRIRFAQPVANLLDLCLQVEEPAHTRTGTVTDDTGTGAQMQAPIADGRAHRPGDLTRSSVLTRAATHSHLAHADAPVRLVAPVLVPFARHLGQEPGKAPFQLPPAPVRGHGLPGPTVSAVPAACVRATARAPPRDRGALAGAARARARGLLRGSPLLVERVCRQGKHATVLVCPWAALDLTVEMLQQLGA